MLATNIPIEMQLYEVKDHDIKLISAKRLEWRYILTSAQSGRMKLCEKFYGFGSMNKILIGSINIELIIESQINN